MPKAFVFAIDWVPEAQDIASGGGLRSLQVTQALRAGGWEVDVAVPRRSRAVRALAQNAPARLREIELFEEDDQISLLRRHAPDLAVWLWPSARRVAFSGFGDMAQLCDLNGLQDYEIMMGVPKLLSYSRRIISESCRGADMVMTGSPEQYGYWLGQLGEGAGSPGFVMAPYALPETLRGTPVRGAAPLRCLHVIGSFYAWNAALKLLARAGIWAAAHADVRLQIIGGTDPGGATRLDDIEALRALEALGSTEILPETGFAAAMGSFAPGSLCLDLNESSTERSLAVPIRIVNAMGHGVPVLTNVDSPLTRRMAEAGAAWLTGTGPGELEAALSAIAALPADEFAARGQNALRFAAATFSQQAAAASINEAASQALERRRRHVRGWTAPKPAIAPLGSVLVISGEMQNLRDLRVDLPLSVLQRRKLVSSYSVWHEGEIVFSSRREAEPVIDVIWVQRSISPEIALLLESMNLPFVYDIDDNLLVSPAYRDPFPAEHMQAARNFVRRAAVLSCSTARMATILQHYTDTALLHKTMVTQNTTRSTPPARQPGPPSCLVWASSDTPALVQSRSDILKAVRDFCLTHGLRLICIGKEPPALLLESDVEVEHAGMLQYQSYIEMLRSLSPAILVCPLEANSERATQDFVNAKSDIKILEALSTGAVAVCSAAQPYLETDLPKPILCDNDYRSWFEGLSQARLACLQGAPAPVIPPWRLASGLGTLPFYEALARARLPRPMALSELTDRLRLLRSRLEPGMVSAGSFDEDFYLMRNPDVSEAVEAGKHESAYSHYVRHGFAEGRLAHAQDQRNPNAEQWWTNLMNSLTDLRLAVDNRDLRIETLKAKRAAKLRLRTGAMR